ncbi:MAG: hypothetical protein ACYC5M_11230 [Anaerolineae bacterium]
MNEALLPAGQVPDTLCHYYEAARGPFRSLSDLPLDEAERVQAGLRQTGVTFASRRAADYLSVRRALEERVRRAFIDKGGRPVRERPLYFTLGPCPWLLSWYLEGAELALSLRALHAETVSFTYGDTFPAMRYQDGKPTRGQVYTVDELPDLIRRFGLPQLCNPEGLTGPDRYIEAQVWAELTWHRDAQTWRGESHG